MLWKLYQIYIYYRLFKLKHSDRNVGMMIFFQKIAFSVCPLANSFTQKFMKIDK